METGRMPWSMSTRGRLAGRLPAHILWPTKRNMAISPNYAGYPAQTWSISVLYSCKVGNQLTNGQYHWVQPMLDEFSIPEGLSIVKWRQTNSMLTLVVIPASLCTSWIWTASRCLPLDDPRDKRYPNFVNQVAFLHSISIFSVCGGNVWKWYWFHFLPPVIELRHLCLKKSPRLLWGAIFIWQMPRQKLH